MALCHRFAYSAERSQWGGIQERNFSKWTIGICMSLFVALVILFFLAEVMIGLGVRKYSQIAREQFPGDRVEILIAVVE